jgi:hypothetical protein
MDVLIILCGLLTMLTIVTWSCARSYFEKGRMRGMEEATREIVRGSSTHCELNGQISPERLEKALNSAKAISGRRRKWRGSSSAPYHAHLSMIGDSIGEACWLKGHAAGLRRKAPAEGRIRVDLTLNELLQLSWLAHLGFQNMMPNYRGFEIHRFSGSDDARESAVAIGKIETAIPVEQRPFDDLVSQFKGRQKLINDWWQEPGDRLTA